MSTDTPQLPISPESFGSISLIRCPVCGGAGRYTEASRASIQNLDDEDIGSIDGSCEGTGVRMVVPAGGEAAVALLAINTLTSASWFDASGMSMSRYDEAVADLHRHIGTYY